MHLRYRFVLPLVAICLALAVAPALASKSAPTAIPVQGAPIEGSITSLPCNVGNTEPVASAIAFILPPDDEYYALLDPANCCPGGATLLSQAHVVLYWSTDCTLPITISIVGSTNVTGGCNVPDRTHVICPPTTYNISAGAGGVVVHNFNLPAACCVSGKVFLEYAFPVTGTCVINGGLVSPALVTDATPTSCTSYNFYPGDPTQRDLVVDYGFPGDLSAWVSGDCCQGTSAMPGTWGRMKTLYR
jgi:hypothetical protein